MAFFRLYQNDWTRTRWENLEKKRGSRTNCSEDYYGHDGQGKFQDWLQLKFHIEATISNTLLQ